MLSAVILAGDASAPTPAMPDAIVRTLSALVGAAIEGLIRDVTLAAPCVSEDLRKIADHAGCELAEASTPGGAIAAGLASARGDLLFVMRAGFAPEPGFAEEIADRFQRSARPRVLRFREAPESLLTRLAPSLARVQGLVAARAVLDAKAEDLAALVRRAGAGPTARSRLRRVD